MNENELIGKIHSSMYHQLQSRGYAAPVDVLIDTGILPKQKYEDWRFGRVRYLEAVCNANLKRLSFVLHQMRVYAQAHGLKPSFCYYKRWGVRKKNGTGHKPVIPLQFSKSGSPEIERSYAYPFRRSGAGAGTQGGAAATRKITTQRRCRIFCGGAFCILEVIVFTFTLIT